MAQRKRERLSRKGFLKTVGAGTVGAALLGAPTVLSGCEKSQVGAEHKPNVILIIIDTLRKDHVGAYGNDWIKTPTLDALAKESLLFTRAHPEAMPTLPARRSIHTGMRTWPTDPPAFGWTPTRRDRERWPRYCKAAATTQRSPPTSGTSGCHRR